MEKFEFPEIVIKQFDDTDIIVCSADDETPEVKD